MAKVMSCRAAAKEPTPRFLAGWWVWYRSESKASDTTKRDAKRLLHAPGLRQYWGLVGRAIAGKHAGLVEWVLSAFLVPAERELHLTGTAKRSTWKSRLRRRHGRDRKRAARVATALREALHELAGWECSVRPDEVVDVAALATRCGVLEHLGHYHGVTAYHEQTLIDVLAKISTKSMLHTLAESLERFSAHDALSEVAELASQKSSWRDYVKAVYGNLAQIETAHQISIQPQVSDWQAIVLALTRQTVLKKDVHEALRAVAEQPKA